MTAFPFDGGDRNRTMSCYGGILRIFRKRRAHNDEFSHFDATHFLDAVRVVLNHIGDGRGAGDVAAVHAGLVDDLVQDNAAAAVELGVKAGDVPEAMDPNGDHALDRARELHCEEFIDPPMFPMLTQLSPATHEAKREPWEVSLMGNQRLFGRRKVTKNARLQFDKGLAQAREFGRVVEIGGVVSLTAVADSRAAVATV